MHGLPSQHHGRHGKGGGSQADLVYICLREKFYNFHNWEVDENLVSRPPALRSARIALQHFFNILTELFRRPFPTQNWDESGAHFSGY